MYKVVLPLKVKKSKLKDFIVNLNNYRNLHYQTLNKTKINYKADIEDQVTLLPSMTGKVHIHYVVYAKTRRVFDIDNVTAIHKKYFQDALTELGVLDEDNYNHIPTNSESFGGIDKENPRVDAYVIPHDSKEYDSFRSFLNIFE